MADQLLRAENMTVGYGGVPLIRDIALSVSGGEILTLVGPNGSGKSTILKSLPCSAARSIWTAATAAVCPPQRPRARSPS